MALWSLSVGEACGFELGHAWGVRHWFGACGHASFAAAKAPPTRTVRSM